MRICVFVAALLLAILPVPAGAQMFGGIGTRAEGMGGAFVAVADDATAAYWNPAGIATGATFDVQGSGGPESSIFVGAALPVLGASFYRTSQATAFTTVSGSPDRQDEGSGEVPVRTLSTTNIGVTVVQTVAPGVVIGTTVRAVGLDVEGVDTSTTFDLDAGAMVSAGGFRFGLTARNLREPEFQVESGAIRMRRQFRVGAALAPRSLPAGVYGPYSLAVDVDLTTTPDPRGEQRGAAVGGEYWLAKGFIGLRAGVRWSTLGDSNRVYAAGFTARLPRSIYLDGQVTKPDGSEGQSEGTKWSAGARITF
jgi:F plasmid transfer operon, TraF, protein